VKGHGMADFCHIDFETRSGADLLKVGADVYAQASTTQPLCLAYAFGDEPVQLWLPNHPPPERLLGHVFSGGITRGHNIGNFEMLIWNNIMALEYGWPELKIEQCEDTMAMAYAMGLPGSLDDASRAAGIPYQKDMKGHRMMLKLSQPKAHDADGKPIFWMPEEVPEDFNVLYEYCKQDVTVERALCQRLLRLSPAEQKLWELDYRINRRGVYVDIQSARIAVQLVESEKVRLDNQMRQVTGNAVATCSAVGQITDWIKLKGVTVPSLAKADVVEMLSLPTLPNECREALLLRQEAAKTSNAKLDAMILGASAGGRMRGLFQYHGASTGRWAGRRVQLQNLPRPKLKQEQIEHVFRILNAPHLRFASIKSEAIKNQTGASALSAVSDCIRGFLRAAPGRDFIAADFASIEARVIAWLAGQEETLEVFKGSGKIYELTAAGIYGCKMEDINKEDPRRQVGKVAVLALGFQGGVGAMQTMAKAYGLKLEPTFELLWKRATDEHKRMAKFIWDMNGHKHDITQKEFVASDLIKQYWRQANPKIVSYWADLNAAAIMAVQNPGQKYLVGAPNRQVTYTMNGSFLWCKLPSGRVLCYPYPKIEMLAAFEDSDTKPTLTCMGVDSYTKKWQRYKNYGGLLAENVTQAVARDLLAEAMFKLEAKKYPVVMHIHDEVVVEVPKNFGSEKEVEQIMAECPLWARDLPIAAEGWRGERFRK
jgi:DNA polymerase